MTNVNLSVSSSVILIFLLVSSEALAQQGYCAAKMGGVEVIIRKGLCTQNDYNNMQSGGKFCYKKKGKKILFVKWGTNCK